MAEKYESKPLYPALWQAQGLPCRGKLVELYTDEDVKNLRRKIRRWTIALCAFSTLALCVCVAFALRRILPVQR